MRGLRSRITTTTPTIMTVIRRMATPPGTSLSPITINITMALYYFLLTFSSCFLSIFLFSSLYSSHCIFHFFLLYFVFYLLLPNVQQERIAYVTIPIRIKWFLLPLNRTLLYPSMRKVLIIVCQNKTTIIIAFLLSDLLVVHLNS